MPATAGNLAANYCMSCIYVCINGISPSRSHSEAHSRLTLAERISMENNSNNNKCEMRVRSPLRSAYDENGRRAANIQPNLNDGVAVVVG